MYDKGSYSLSQAVAARDAARVKELLNADPYAPMSLISGARVSDFAWVVESGLLSVNYRNMHDCGCNRSLLHYAVLRSIPHVRYLVEAKADLEVTLNPCDGIGGTPLNAAICWDGGEVVRVLLNAGASINNLDHKRYITVVETWFPLRQRCLDAIRLFSLYTLRLRWPRDMRQLVVRMLWRGRYDEEWGRGGFLAQKRRK